MWFLSESAIWYHILHILKDSMLFCQTKTSNFNEQHVCSLSVNCAEIKSIKLPSVVCLEQVASALSHQLMCLCFQESWELFLLLGQLCLWGEIVSFLYPGMSQKKREGERGGGVGGGSSSGWFAWTCCLLQKHVTFSQWIINQHQDVMQLHFHVTGFLCPWLNTDSQQTDLSETERDRQLFSHSMFLLYVRSHSLFAAHSLWQGWQYKGACSLCSACQKSLKWFVFSHSSWLEEETKSKSYFHIIFLAL